MYPLFLGFFLTMGTLSACTFPLFVDDFSEIQDRYKEQVERVLNIRDNGEVLVEGEIDLLRQGCEINTANCHIVMSVDGVVISVFYNSTTSDGACQNPNLSNEISKLERGYLVRVYGKYFGVGNISVCDKETYYIAVIPPET